jgi:RNA dependent RNA polymerase
LERAFNGGVKCGFDGIVLSGSLTFSNDAADPFFKIRLQPIRLELSHRLGRRLGNDRFLEVDIPVLTGNRIPKFLADLGDRGREIINKWLITTTHCLFGREWKPFYVRKIKTKDKVKGVVLPDIDSTKRLCLFAVSGNGFVVSNDPIREPRGINQFVMSIEDLLELIRPTEENKGQSYLKLFSRTSLGILF